MAENANGAESVQQLSQVVEDLRSSNYFRAWALIWVAMFIVFWVGFATYTNHVDATTQVYATAFAPQTQLAYPDFHFRLSGWQNAPAAIVWDSISCVWNHTYPLAIGACHNYPAPANNFASCFAVFPSNGSFIAYARPHSVPDDLFAETHLSSFIWCNFTVSTAQLGTTPNWVAWELEAERFSNYGADSYAPIYFGPFTINQVLLEKFLVGGTEYWERNHVYLPPPYGWNNTGAANVQYTVSTAMSSTTVTVYEQFGLNYRSWNALADIGGLAFALWLIHTCVMIIIGLFLENDSTFLRATHHHQHHHHHKHHAEAVAAPTETSRLVGN